MHAAKNRKNCIQSAALQIEKVCRRPQRMGQPQNFCNYYKQWLYECKEEEYTVHVWSLHTGRNFLT